MKLSELLDLNYNTNQTFNKKSIFSKGMDIAKTKIYTLEGSIVNDEIFLIDSNISAHELNNDVDIVILSEPKFDEMTEEDLMSYKNTYENILSQAIIKEIEIIHFVSNFKWYTLFQEQIIKHELPIYLTENDYKKLKHLLSKEDKHIIDDLLYLKDFNLYSNDINSNIIIDLTLYDGVTSFYNKNINSILNMLPKFNHVTILIEKDSYFPDMDFEHVNIIETNFIPSELLEEHSYVYLFSNKAYDTSQIYKLIYYAANSKVVFSNYNFKINNMLPSVILNLTDNLDWIEPAAEDEAFDIINENRNTVLFKHTTLNFLENIYKTRLNEKFIHSYNLEKVLPKYESNLYLNNENKLGSDLHGELNDSRYDLEDTLAFPILFLGMDQVTYKESFLKLTEASQELEIQYNRNLIPSVTKDKKLSVIVPIHNNGKYLKYKCFSSLKRLKCFNELEIIFVDDGSTDNETLRIVEDIRATHDIVYKRFETGSGSASRPRNEGVQLATTDLITYLDPDNEAVDDGYSVLLNEIHSDPELDMVVGNIIREDNEKRNSIRYSTKITRALNSDVITNPKEALIKTNLTVQSIQGLIVKKNIIIENNINMVEQAAGQDTLYFQQLLLNCKKVKVVDHMIHSYYAFVEGSITNTVTHKFFEKFYKVEQERIKFLIEENLIEEYMNVKFNPYIINWYMEKYKSVPVYDKKKSYELILKIVDLYSDYSKDFSETILKFIK
ncbi:glycosyltransferase family 2 protein [Salinicoccus sp. Marseille-QA3877]